MDFFYLKKKNSRNFSKVAALMEQAVHSLIWRVNMSPIFFKKAVKSTFQKSGEFPTSRPPSIKPITQNPKISDPDNRSAEKCQQNNSRREAP